MSYKPGAPATDSARQSFNSLALDGEETTTSGVSCAAIAGCDYPALQAVSGTALAPTTHPELGP